MQPRLAPRVCRRVVSLAALYCSTARRGLRLRGPLGGETITVPGGLAHSNSILELPVSVPPAFTRWPRFLHILFGRGPSLRRLWGIYGPTEAHLMGGNPTAASGRMHNDSRRGRRANPYRWAGPAYLLSWGRPFALGRVTPCLLDGSILVKRALLFTYFSQVPRLVLIAGRVLPLHRARPSL
jgi:hypothetical protein